MVAVSCLRSFASQCRNQSTRTFHNIRGGNLVLRHHPPPSRTTRRFIQTQRYAGFAPPSPESLGRAAPPKQYKRTIKWGRRFLVLGAVTGTLYLLDTQLYASSITRSVRT